MKYTPLSFDVNPESGGFVVDWDSLFAALATLTDRRDARGLRYALVTVLIFIVLAKLAGEDHLCGIAQWVRLRKEALAEALGLAKPQAPHATTYSPALRQAVDIDELEQVVSDFFASQPETGQKSGIMNRNSNANHEVHDKHKPAFLITIDTEGDNLWAKPRKITTQNARSLPRFQSLCESYGLRPTYLANYEMANSRAFQEFGKDILRRNTGEIGLHVHAWNTPPLVPLTEDDFAFQPYLIEYPQDVMRAKVAVTTDLLEDTFGVKVVSHRAGRWSFNETYAQILVEKGYRVDCSVTPHVSWRDCLGDPKQAGGTDYSHFPDQAYFLDLLDISRPGDSSLLELPMTIVSTQTRGVDLLYQVSRNSSIAQRAWRCLFRPSIWLRPNGKNLKDLLWIISLAIRERRKYVEFMLHSSELMPGGSHISPRDQDIEALYADLQVLFATVKGSFAGATLKEYHQILTRDAMNRMPSEPSLRLCNNPDEPEASG